MVPTTTAEACTSHFDARDGDVVRFYMRYSLGFAFTPAEAPIHQDHYWGRVDQAVLSSDSRKQFMGVNYNGSVNYPSSLTWAASQGGTPATGSGTSTSIT